MSPWSDIANAFYESNNLYEFKSNRTDRKMKIKKSSNRFMRLKTRYFSSKGLALWAINKKLKKALGHGQEFGKLVDLQLNRQEKNIGLELEHQGEVNTIMLSGYGFENRKGRPHLIWKDINFTGPAQHHYQSVFKKIESIELSKKYVSLVEAML